MAKSTLTFQQLMKNLEQKKYAPVYFLCGEETYFIDCVSDYIEDHVLNEGEKGFNQTVVYGKDTDIKSLVATARRYPMMANQQVVIVKEAQNLKNVEELIQYLEKPVESTILVLNFKNKTPDKRTKFYKTLEPHVFFEAKRIYDNQVPAWIKDYLSSKNIKADEKAIALISESIGADLSRLANELDKLILNLGDSGHISVAEVEKSVGISKDYNVFELQSAISSRNFSKAIRIINHFAAGKNQFGKPVLLLGSLYGYFTKVMLVHSAPVRDEYKVASLLGVSPMFVKEYLLAAKNYSMPQLEKIIEELKICDLKSKGVEGGSESELFLLKELMVKIFF